MTGPVPPPALKRLGQHFLIDQNIVRKIISLADLKADETVLEIGPGRGILTKSLCAAAHRVVAVEIDPQLQAYLTGALVDCKNLNLHIGDALEFAYDTLPAGLVVVANLPYYVSTPLLFKLLDLDRRVNRMVLMLQTEVAKRLAAEPGTREYGSLSVRAQYAARIKLAFPVSAQCFRPRPDVGSSVVSLQIRPTRELRGDDEARFTRIVRAAFAHRRKTLSNSLRDEGLPPEQIASALSQSHIDPTRRAETLSVDEYIALIEALR